MVKRANYVQLAMTNEQKSELLNIVNSYKYMGFEYLDSLTFNKREFEKNTLPDNIDQLENYVSHCALCTLQSNRDQFIFGLGDKNSKIYIVGLNHFSLKSDVIFDSFRNMCEKVLLVNMDEIYITNILKCSVNLNSSQVEESIEICIDYLKKQLELAKPDIIITLGEAYNKMMNSNENISDISGNIYDYNSIKLLPIMHPEFIYKNPSYKLQMLNDLKKIKNILEKQ